MSCEQVRLSDGSTVLVNVKPGQKLLPEDVAALEEFRRLLAIANTASEDVPEGVVGYPVGGRPVMGQPS
jgi:hypothetical protein